MTNQITTAGFIVTDSSGLIHGTGLTNEASAADMRRTMAMANIELLPDDADPSDQLGSWVLASEMKTIPATQALLDLVENHGGDCTWRKVGGVACTREEEEG